MQLGDAEAYRFPDHFITNQPADALEHTWGLAWKHVFFTEPNGKRISHGGTPRYAEESHSLERAE